MSRALTIVLGLTLSTAFLVAAGPTEKPLTKDQVMGLVRSGLGDDTGAKAVEQRGIDFEPQEDFLRSLKQAGTSDAFLQALRKSTKRATPSAVRPLSRVDIIGLLSGDVSSHRVAMLVDERGIDFAPTSDYLDTLRAAGAEDVLITALRNGKVIKPQFIEADAEARQAEVQQHVTRGLQFRRAGKLAEAESEYRAAVRLAPDKSALHASLAFILAVEKKGDEAISEGNEGVRLNPDNDAAHNSLGVAYATKGDPDMAIAEFREAVRLARSNPDPHNNIGVELRSKGDLEGAATEFREALRLNPRYDLAHFNLGVTLERLGDRKGALEEFRTASTLKPDNSRYRVHYERLSRIVNR